MKNSLAVKIVCLLLILAMITSCTSKPSNVNLLDPNSPITITISHYYNGSQHEAFSTLVREYNKTVGAELGIQVDEKSFGSITDLTTSIQDSIDKKVGANPLPNIFASYADTVYAFDNVGIIADLQQYLAEEEKNLYIDSYIQEGQFGSNNEIKLFPTAKSTEVMMISATDWEPFAQATGATTDAFATIEGLVETSRNYYNWTDSLTPDIANDGKAFFGRDAFANYMLIGAMQLGTEIFSVENNICNLNFDKATARKLWDNHYLPIVAGWFAAENRFRSDDVRLGTILGYVGSTTSATFFPDYCVISDTENYPIEPLIFAPPKFADGENFAVQQGASMAVVNTNEAEIYASVQFLKWLTLPENNAAFTTMSSYLPVTKQASEKAYLENVLTDSNPVIKNVLLIAAEITEENQMYTNKAFKNGTDARKILEYAMPDQAAADRAEFVALLEEGAPYDEALAYYASDENFENWYNATLQSLEECVQK